MSFEPAQGDQVGAIRGRPIVDKVDDATDLKTRWLETTEENAELSLATNRRRSPHAGPYGLIHPHTRFSMQMHTSMFSATSMTPKRCPSRISLLAAATLLLAMSSAHALTTSNAEYKDGKTRIAATYKSDKAACDSLKDNAKDICVQEGKAKEKVALAENEYAHTGKVADDAKVRKARAESNYAVAKEKCDDQSGNAKDVCVKEAKSIEVKALADAKMVKTVGAARTGAATDINDANYKVAAEKCDALASDAKASCVSAAKAKFGKT